MRQTGRKAFIFPGYFLLNISSFLVRETKFMNWVQPKFEKIPCANKWYLCLILWLCKLVSLLIRKFWSIKTEDDPSEDRSSSTHTCISTNFPCTFHLMPVTGTGSSLYKLSLTVAVNRQRIVSRHQKNCQRLEGIFLLSKW